MSKVAALPLTDSLYNWLCDFLNGRQHFTKFQSAISTLAPINAGVIQGSAIGPAAFVICASDLHAITPGNKTGKYADDIYLIVPSTNSSSIPSELNHIQSWAESNNLKLNPSKSKEIIFKKTRNRLPAPPPTHGLNRVQTLKILGVTLNSNLSMSDHVDDLVSKAGQTMYALKMLKSNGLAHQLLHNVCKSTLVSRLTYASPAWSGFANQQDLSRIQSLLNRATRWGLCNLPKNEFEILCTKADSKFFNKIRIYDNHVLNEFLPPKRTTTYNLRTRAHNLSLPVKSSLLQRNFLCRMLFRDMY